MVSLNTNNFKIFCLAKEFRGFEFRISNFENFAEILAELLRREKAANIKPDPDIDIYMKVTQTDCPRINC